MKDNEKSNLRYNIVNIVIYAIGIVLILRLFNFQIVHGEEYRQMSNNRLTREITVTATRGNIVDRTGNVIVGNTMGFELQLYKSKIDNQTLNKTIINVIEILDKNGDTYIDTLPIKINPFEYSYEGDALKTWKENNKIDQNADAEEAFKTLAEQYEIEGYTTEQIRKIMGIRYRIKTEGYSSIKPLIISKNISRQSVIELNERSGEFGGIDIAIESVRDYKYRKPCIAYNRLYG